MTGFLSKKKSEIYKTFNSMRDSLKAAFSTIKEELDDHREAINENSNEISANYEYLVKLEDKLDKLSERLDDIQLMVEQSAGQKIKAASIELSKTEQKIFMLLYTIADAITPAEIAQRLNIREDMAADAIKCLIGKGVSIVHKLYNGAVSVCLDREFKEQHAKNNLVKIDGTTILENVDLMRKAVPVA